MSEVGRLAIVDPDDRGREELKQLLLRIDATWLEAECSDYDAFRKVVADTSPNIAIVCLDHDQNQGLQLIEILSRSARSTSIVAVSSATDGALILNAMRAGAKEFVPAPVKEAELMSALDRLGQRTGESGEASPLNADSCRVISVAGADGGVGSTSIAVGLGCTLAQDPESRVALIDLDTALGDADVFLDSMPDYTLSDVAQNIARLDLTLLKRSMTEHSSGLFLLPRPVHLQEVDYITPDDLSQVFQLLRQAFTHVIIDLSKTYSPLDILALQESTYAFLVTQLDLPCLRNVVRLMMSFRDYDLSEKTRIVVNRVGMGAGQISLKKAKETIGGEIFWQVPNDYRVMSEVRNNGVSLIEHAPKSGITQSMLGLAAAVNENLDVSALSKKSDGVSKWLSFLPNR